MRFGGRISQKCDLDKIATMVMKKDLSGLKRLPSVQKKYNKYSAKIKREYGSLETFVTQKFLSYDTEYALSVNEFPYNVRALHLVLWSVRALSNREIETILQKELE